MEIDRKVSIVPFEPGLLPLVRRFSESYWKRPTEDAYFDWRYLQPLAFSRMFVALRGDDECAGTLFALRKTWRLRGEPLPVLEVFDWHALAELRGAGAGIRLMRAMMKQPERIWSVGGTGDVHATLPLMGWQDVTVAKGYELLVGRRLMAERVRHARGVPPALTRAALTLVPRSVFGPRLAPAPANAEVSASAEIGDDVLALYEGDTGYDCVQQPVPEQVHWMMRGRWSGTFRILRFRVDGRLRGWALIRTHVGGHGRQGMIVELFAPRPDVALYRWMVGECSTRLLEDRPERVATRASCPVLQQALVATGFRRAPIEVPVRTWPKAGFVAPANPHFTYLHSDGPINPYVTEV